VRTQLKELSPGDLGQALRTARATWISVQRLPREGEREALESSTWRAGHDASSTNADLEEISR